MKNGGKQWQVDDELLTETGRGGLFTDGYLQGAPLVSYLDGTETPLFVFGSGKRGVTRVDGSDTERIPPSSGYRAITALTDRRVQFVVGGGDNGGDWAQSIRLSEVDRVSVDEGLIRSQLTISADGTEWTVHLKDVDTERVVEFLEDASWAWIRVEETLADARKHLVDASQGEKSREYGAAETSLQAAGERIDEAETIAADLPPEATTGIHERVDQIAERYRETERRVHASRATHLLDKAEQRWREEAYEDAYEAFTDAREAYRSVLDIYGLEPDKREAMRDRIGHVDRNLELLASAPLDRAHETRNAAIEATDPEMKLDRWSAAIEQYRTVLELDWGKDHKRFEGDVDQLRDRVAEAVDGVLDTRRDIASDYRDAGDEHIEDGAVGEARAAYSEAMSQLEAAEELAWEFQPDAVADLQHRLDDLADCISEATETVGSNDGYDDFDNWVTLAPDEESEEESFEPADSGFDWVVDREETAYETVDNGVSTAHGPPEELDADLPEDTEPSMEPASETVDAVAALRADTLVEVVESVWTELGWTTSELDDAVLATRTDPPESLVVGVVADGPVTVADVDGCMVTRDDTDADRVTLVTNAEVDAVATRRASATGVELLDSTALAGLIERCSLADVLPDATV